MKNSCSRCGDPASHVLCVDPDVPSLYFCRSCKEIGPAELLQREVFSLSPPRTASRMRRFNEWKKAFKEVKAPKQDGLGL